MNKILEKLVFKNFNRLVEFVGKPDSVFIESVELTNRALKPKTFRFNSLYLIAAHYNLTLDYFVMAVDSEADEYLERNCVYVPNITPFDSKYLRDRFLDLCKQVNTISAHTERELGFSSNTISFVKNSGINPSFEYVWVLANHFRKPIDYIYPVNVTDRFPVVEQPIIEEISHEELVIQSNTFRVDIADEYDYEITDTHIIFTQKKPAISRDYAFKLLQDNLGNDKLAELLDNIYRIK